MRLIWPAKDPSEVLDYSIDWSNRLTSDRIVSSAFTVAPGANVSIVANSFSNTITTVWLASGTAGRVARVTNHVVTFGGREFEESVSLTIQEN